MNAEYRSLLQRAADDPAVRVIVVTGPGAASAPGPTPTTWPATPSAAPTTPVRPTTWPRPGYGVRPEFDAELAYHFGVPKPIIAAVNGPAAGIGFALACYCDLRIAAVEAKLTTAHGRLGLPCPFGLAWLLPRLIGPGAGPRPHPHQPHGDRRRGPGHGAGQPVVPRRGAGRRRCDDYARQLADHRLARLARRLQATGLRGDAHRAPPRRCGRPRPCSTR